MTSVLLIIEGITKILEKFNKGHEQGLKVYRFIEGLFKGTPEAFPELPDDAVILLFKQRADRGVSWVDEELARLAAAAPPAVPPSVVTEDKTTLEQRRAQQRGEL
jgi:hypothetical protein